MAEYSGDQDRMLANLVRIGTVKELDAAKARVKIQMGELISDWLPWVTTAAGSTRVYSAPSVGSQVVVLAPSGEITQGVVLPAVYQDAYGPNADSGDTHRVTFADGTVVEYDQAASSLKADLGQSKITATRALVKLEIGGVSIELTSGGISIKGNVTLDGNISQTGNITSSGDHVAGGISLQQHRHGSVQPGPGTTGVPA